MATSFDNVHSLVAIFCHLSFKDTVMCAMVSTHWRSAVSTLNSSQYWYRTAMSRIPLLQDAVNELLEYVQSAPFWPNFAIVFAGNGVDLLEVVGSLKKRLPESIKMIGWNTAGVMGNNVVTGLSDDERKEGVYTVNGGWTPKHICLSVGRFPGIIPEIYTYDYTYEFFIGLHESSSSNSLDQTNVDTAEGLKHLAPICMLLLLNLPKKQLDIDTFAITLQDIWGEESSFALMCTEISTPWPILAYNRYRSSRDEASSSICRETKVVLDTVMSKTFPKDALGDVPSCDSNDFFFSVAALVFLDDGTQGLQKLKCSVISSGLRTPEQLVPKGPVYETVRVEQLHATDNPDLLVCLKQNGELQSVENMFREWGQLTHVSIVNPGRGGNNLVKYFRCKREMYGQTEIMEELLIRIQNWHDHSDGSLQLQFHTPNQALAIESMDQALSSMSPSNPRPNLVAAFEFLSPDCYRFKNWAYMNNRFLEYFPNAPLAASICLHLYGKPTVIRTSGIPSRSVNMCLNESETRFCESMFLVLFTN